MVPKEVNKEKQSNDASASLAENIGEPSTPYKERGSMGYADIPDCRAPTDPYEEYKDDREEQVWTPQNDERGDLWYYEYLMDGRSALTNAQEEELKIGNVRAMENACKDVSEQYISDVLHTCNYDQELARDVIRGSEVPKEVYEEWSELEKELLVEGLRLFGRNFQKIKDIALPTKDMKSVLSYYYSWKWAEDLEPVKRGSERVYIKKPQPPKNGEGSQNVRRRSSRTLTRSLCRATRESLKAAENPTELAELENLSIEERVCMVYANVQRVGSPPRYSWQPAETESEKETTDAKSARASIGVLKSSSSKAGRRISGAFAESMPSTSFAELSANDTPKIQTKPRKSPGSKAKPQPALLTQRRSQRNSTSVYATKRKQQNSLDEEPSTSARSSHMNSMPITVDAADPSIDKVAVVGDENCDPQQQSQNLQQRSLKRRRSICSIKNSKPEIDNGQNIPVS